MFRPAVSFLWLALPALAQFAQPPSPQQSFEQPLPQQPYSQPPISPAPAPDGAPAGLLPPEQLDNLVAPVALYPDQLLSQVLAASTYPLEIVEAQQWLQRNPGLRGQALLEAARQQTWDPSVQALVAFPDVLALLNRDVSWTTALGNAFLNQQADVMSAIQRMRAQAQSNGRLVDTPQQIVTTQAQDGQEAIQIQPANPQVVYVPQYNPAYVWGPPTWGAYPELPYPAEDTGFDWGLPILLGSLFTGLLSWGGWGWGLSWLSHSLLLNPLFFSHFFGGGGFGGGYGRDRGYESYGGYGRDPVVWAHNPAHRLGVPYTNAALATRFHEGYSGSNFTMSRSFAPFRSSTPPAAGFSGQSLGRQNFGHQNFTGQSFRGSVPSQSFRSPAQSFRSPASNFGGQSLRGSAVPRQSFRSPAPQQFASSPNRGFSAPAPRGGPSREMARNFSSPRPSSPHFSAPRSSGSHFSAPHVSAPHFSSPHFSRGGHSGGGHSSGGHSGGGHSGGGHSGGHSGGHHR